MNEVGRSEPISGETIPPPFTFNSASTSPLGNEKKISKHNGTNVFNMF